MKAWTSSSTYSTAVLPSTKPSSIQQCSTRRKEGAYDMQVSLLIYVTKKEHEMDGKCSSKQAWVAHCCEQNNTEPSQSA